MGSNLTTARDRETELFDIQSWLPDGYRSCVFGPSDFWTMEGKGRDQILPSGNLAVNLVSQSVCYPSSVGQFRVVRSFRKIIAGLARRWRSEISRKCRRHLGASRSNELRLRPDLPHSETARPTQRSAIVTNKPFRLKLSTSCLES